jgi:predicted alpha/beta hydrolase
LTKKFTVTEGDRVAYSAQWLRSVGASHTPFAHARGNVASVHTVLGGSTFATIDWGNADIPATVNVANLAKVGANTRFAQS